MSHSKNPPFCRLRHRVTARRRILERLECRTLLSVDGFAPIDGVGNNLESPELGTVGEQFIRVAPSAYDDGLSEPARLAQLNPREISDVLCPFG